MAELLYRVTVRTDEASTYSPLASNRLVVELVCCLHADLIGSDSEVAARDVARKAIKRHFPKSEEPGYLVVDRLDGVAASDFFGWNTLDCGCRAVITPDSAFPEPHFPKLVSSIPTQGPQMSQGRIRIALWFMKTSSTRCCGPRINPTQILPDIVTILVLNDCRPCTRENGRSTSADVKTGFMPRLSKKSRAVRISSAAKARTLHSRPPLYRFQEIFHAIKTGRYPNRTKLAETIEVTTKTIQRDIDYMRYQLSVPIEFDFAEGGYYFTRLTTELPLF